MENRLKGQNVTKYIPTEFLKGQCREQSDLWSLGMSMAEMLDCQTLSFTSKWSLDVIDFMSCCVASNVKDRPALNDLLLVPTGYHYMMNSTPSSENPFNE